MSLLNIADYGYFVNGEGPDKEITAFYMAYSFPFDVTKLETLTAFEDVKPFFNVASLLETQIRVVFPQADIRISGLDVYELHKALEKARKADAIKPYPKSAVYFLTYRVSGRELLIQVQRNTRKKTEVDTISYLEKAWEADYAKKESYFQVANVNIDDRNYMEACSYSTARDLGSQS